VLTPAAVQHCCIGRECWWLFGRPACFATSACRQPLPRFPLTWSARATGSCTTGSWARMWYMHDGAPAHLSRAVRDVLSNTCPDQGIGTGGPAAWPPRQIWILGIYICGDTKMRLLLTTKNHFTTSLWMSVRLSATAMTSLHGCGDPWWDVSRRAVSLMEDILSTYYKYTLSAITHKLNVSEHMLIWTFFISFWYVELVTRVGFVFVEYEPKTATWALAVCCKLSVPWKYLMHRRHVKYTRSDAPGMWLLSLSALQGIAAKTLKKTGIPLLINIWSPFV
jgi:hypothetical protein